MYYARHGSRLFRHIPLKNANIPKKCKLNFVNKSFYSNILDNRLKSSLESVRFIKKMTDEAMLVEDKICSTEVPKSECRDTFGKFKGEPLLGEEFGAVYTKHEPTMFGDWSHMGRVTDF
ncbi:hypothetical protein MACK_003211 [Theileria orientalis]|uniref:Succinate dehydrogenase assembly factor 4, mitochondrial n=1 Tax=Theileria orientalis TaxID=68886 RepID=A0A976XJJ2_THEOR|nr:hypothetical protein MACK_003211 [Theileria orientalis]